MPVIFVLNTHPDIDMSATSLAIGDDPESGMTVRSARTAG